MLCVNRLPARPQALLYMTGVTGDEYAQAIKNIYRFVVIFEKSGKAAHNHLTQCIHPFLHVIADYVRTFPYALIVDLP